MAMSALQDVGLQDPPRKTERETINKIKNRTFLKSKV